MSPSDRLPGRAMLLAFASGVAALMHELLWTRRLVDVLGASAESSTRVFGCFFLGLALGAAVAGMISHRVTRPWRAVALAEVGIVALSLPVLFLLPWTQWLWPTLGEQGLTGWAGGPVKLLLSAITILPPAICMGLVVPFVLQGLRHLPASEGRGIRLYAANTCGGAVGLLIPILLTLPKLGVGGSMVVAALLNLLIALGALWLDRSAEVGKPAAEIDSGKRMPRWLLAVSFFSGAAILATEVAATQVLMLAASLSFYAPAAILFAVIATLAVAALIAARWERRMPGAITPARLSLVMAGAAVATFIGPFLFFAVAGRLHSLAENASVFSFFCKLVCLALFTVGPGMLLAGLVFPFTVSLARTAGALGSKRLAALLAVNGVGGTVGAELAWRFLLPSCGVYGSIGMVAVAYASGAAILAWRTSPTLLWRFAAVGVLLILLASFRNLQALPTVNAHVGLRVLDQVAGREGTVAVVESAWAGRSILLSNQYLLGSSSARWDQERQTHLPLLLHRAPRDVAFIGLATGITPGAALAHRNLSSITAVELSPLVQRAAGRFFSEFNNGISHSRRARIVTEDGRTFLAACPGRFDVVIGDLFLPWGPGEARLFSLEHFRSVRQSLREGGVFCQWLPMHQLTPRQFEVIAHTFQAAFPRTTLFCNGFGGDTPALALVGFREGQPVDWATIQFRCTELRESEELLDPLLRHREGVVMVYLGELDRLLTPSSDLPLNTLGNLWVELDATRERLTGQPGTKYFFGGRWFQFCEQRRAALQTSTDKSKLSESDKDLLRLADLWMRWEHARKRDSRAADALAARLRVDVPSAIRRDPGADWNRWAGTAVPWATPSMEQNP